jgi:hypothetical protein
MFFILYLFFLLTWFWQKVSDKLSLRDSVFAHYNCTGHYTNNYYYIVTKIKNEYNHYSYSASYNYILVTTNRDFFFSFQQL